LQPGIREQHDGNSGPVNGGIRAFAAAEFDVSMLRQIHLPRAAEVMCPSLAAPITVLSAYYQYSGNQALCWRNRNSITKEYLAEERQRELPLRFDARPFPAGMAMKWSWSEG